MCLRAPKIAFSLCLCSLVIVLLIAVRAAIAEFYFERAKNIIETPDGNLALLSLPELDNARKQLALAIEYRANHVWAIDYLAYLNKYQWDRWPDTAKPKDSKLLTSALAYHQRSINIRREWPISHLKRAQILALFDELDESFYVEFDKTYETGRYESRTVLALFEVGIKNWYRLPANYRDKTIELGHLALMQKSTQIYYVKDMLNTANLYRWVCQNLTKSDRQEQLCRAN